MTTGSVLHPSNFNLVGTFDEQVDNLLTQIRLSRHQVENLVLLYRDLEQTLRKVWPGCTVHAFGSIITGLGIQSSDVDCYVEIPNWFKTHGDVLVMTARDILRQQPMFKEVFAIPGAKVPIVKFYHVPTDRNGDVSFRSPSGVRNSKLIAHLLHMDKRAMSLAIIIKYWAKVHKLTGTNFMPNYALTLLVIFFLQQRNILPAISWLQKHASKHIIDNWNTSFSETYYISDNNDSVYQLLGNFFQYFGGFDYGANLISPFLGLQVGKELFMKLESVPDSFLLYKNNVQKKKCEPIKTHSVICIQDPFEHCRNCSAAVHPNLARKIIDKFKEAGDTFKENNSSDFLKLIFQIMPEDVEEKVEGKNRRKHQNRVAKNRQLHPYLTHLREKKGNIRNMYNSTRKWRV